MLLGFVLFSLNAAKRGKNGLANLAKNDFETLRDPITRK